jgi:hypothetical protein
MEHVNGGNLKARMQNEPMSARTAAQVVLA